MQVTVLPYAILTFSRYGDKLALLGRMFMVMVMEGMLAGARINLKQQCGAEEDKVICTQGGQGQVKQLQQLLGACTLQSKAQGKPK